jgi:hypothetical protein
MDSKEKEEEQPKLIRIGNIPIIAIVFPPIGLLMLIQYMLTKLKTEKKEKSK